MLRLDKMIKIIFITFVTLLPISGCKSKITLLKTPLEKAIQCWLNDDGNLDDFVGEIRNQPIKKPRDAKAVINGLKSINLDSNQLITYRTLSSLLTLSSFFQNVESKEAYDEFRNIGLLELIRIFNEGRDIKGYESNLMFILKILAMYENHKAIQTFLQAAKNSYAVNSYLWFSIFDSYDDHHSDKKRIINAFRDKLPDGMIASAYLFYVNKLALKKLIDNHPFNSPEGITKLTDLLSDRNKEKYDYAYDAAVAIAFIKKQEDRNKLLELAFKYPEMKLRIEAAWASAKNGDNNGVLFLKEKASEEKYSKIACQYLKELNINPGVK